MTDKTQTTKCRPKFIIKMVLFYFIVWMPFAFPAFIVGCLVEAITDGFTGGRKVMKESINELAEYVND